MSPSRQLDSQSPVCIQIHILLSNDRRPRRNVTRYLPGDHRVGAFRKLRGLAPTSDRYGRLSESIPLTLCKNSQLLPRPLTSLLLLRRSLISRARIQPILSPQAALTACPRTLPSLLFSFSTSLSRLLRLLRSSLLQPGGGRVFPSSYIL